MAQHLKADILEDAERFVSLFVKTSVAVRELSEKYKIGERQAERYLAAARKKWRVAGSELSPEQRAERKGLLRRAAQEVYTRSLAKEDRRTALAAVRLMADLDGLATDTTQAQTVEVKVTPGQHPSGIVQETGGAHSPEAIKKRIDELLARRGKRVGSDN